MTINDSELPSEISESYDVSPKILRQKKTKSKPLERSWFVGEGDSKNGTIHEERESTGETGWQHIGSRIISQRKHVQKRKHVKKKKITFINES